MGQHGVVTAWDCDSAGLGLCGIVTAWGCDNGVGLRQRGIGTAWDCDSMVFVTVLDCGSVGLLQPGIVIVQDWDCVGV